MISSSLASIPRREAVFKLIFLHHSHHLSAAIKCEQQLLIQLIERFAEAIQVLPAAVYQFCA